MENIRMTNLLVIIAFATTLLLTNCHSSGRDTEQMKKETPMPPPCKSGFKLNLALGIESGIGSLQWCTVPEATSYVVEQATGDDFAELEEMFSGYTWLYKLGDPKQHTEKRYYRVRAVKDEETLAISNTISYP